MWHPVILLSLTFNTFLFSLSFYLFPLLFLLFCFRNQMGNLLKVLTCTELDQGPNFFLDFESEQSFCLAWCPSLFPATNILQVPLSELSLQIYLSQQQNRVSQCFCICKCFVQMSLIGQVVRIFDLFYMPSLILRTQIANTKIFKSFLENLKKNKSDLLLANVHDLTISICN